MFTYVLYMLMNSVSAPLAKMRTSAATVSVNASFNTLYRPTESLSLLHVASSN